MLPQILYVAAPPVVQAAFDPPILLCSPVKGTICAFFLPLYRSPPNGLASGISNLAHSFPPPPIQVVSYSRKTRMGLPRIQPCKSGDILWFHSGILAAWVGRRLNFR